jgi:hypothetical protein
LVSFGFLSVVVSLSAVSSLSYPLVGTGSRSWSWTSKPKQCAHRGRSRRSAFRQWSREAMMVSPRTEETTDVIGWQFLWGSVKERMCHLKQRTTRTPMTLFGVNAKDQTYVFGLASIRVSSDVMGIPPGRVQRHVVRGLIGQIVSTHRKGLRDLRIPLAVLDMPMERTAASRSRSNHACIRRDTSWRTMDGLHFVRTSLWRSLYHPHEDLAPWPK